MNVQIKQQWVEALRSGEYNQGRRYLHHEDKFCVLGVLCDLHSKETGNEWDPHPSIIDGRSFYLGAGQFPPPEVHKWADLEVRINLHVPKRSESMPIAKVNDMFCTFEELADLIEAQL